MRINGLKAMLYYWLITFAIFSLFNGLKPTEWGTLSAVFCGFIMFWCAGMAHMLYWDEDHEQKKGDKQP